VLERELGVDDTGVEEVYPSVLVMKFSVDNIAVEVVVATRAI